MEEKIILELKKISSRLNDVDARLEIIDARIGGVEKINREIREETAGLMNYRDQTCKNFGQLYKKIDDYMA